MDKKRTYYGYTTYQQRKLLFETWEETGNVSQASRKARVSRGTFYQWKPRYEAEGYAGLEEGRSHAPHHAQKISAEIAERVASLRRAHPEWGKMRLAHELAKEHSWEAVVSPNTVKRILEEAGLWATSGGGEKGGG
jgi:transposase